jgi:hypothetical protein
LAFPEVEIGHVTHHSKRAEGVKLDEAVEVTKEDGYWKKPQVRWFSDKKTMQLNIFGDHHPNQLSKHGVVLSIL